MLRVDQAKPSNESEVDALLRVLRETADRYRGIRCPKCGWRPSKDSKWCCGTRDCVAPWNTFDSHGKCPHCGRQWSDTICLSCHRWSPHDEWYETPPQGSGA